MPDPPEVEVGSQLLTGPGEFLFFGRGFDFRPNNFPKLTGQRFCIRRTHSQFKVHIA